MDFDPGDESDTDDAKSNEDTNSTPEVPILRPQELRLDLIEEPTAAQGTYIPTYFFFNYMYLASYLDTG